MADSSIWGLCVTLLIDFLLFCILFVLFCVYRNFRGRRVNIEGVPKVAVYESEWSLIALLIHVIQMDSSMFHDHCGGAAQLFLKLHKFVILLFGLLTVVAFAVLVPVYEAGTASVSNDLNKMGYPHVRDDNNLVIAPVLCFVLFVALTQFLLYSFFKSTRESNFHTAFSGEQGDCTLQVFGLDRSDSPDTSEEKLREWFDTHFPNAVVRVEVIPEFSKAFPVYEKLKEEQEKLKLYRAYERETQKSAEVRLSLCGSKVPAILHFEKLEEKHLTKLHKYYMQGKERNCGVGFITFRSTEAMERAKSSYRSYENVSFMLMSACSSSDVNWQYVNSNPLHGACFMFVLTIAFILVFFIILTPANFINFFTSFFQTVAGDVVAGLLGEYLPTLLLLVYQQVILPYAIDFLVSTERHISKSEATVSSMTKFLLFNSFYVFFLQFFGLQFIKLVDLAINNTLDSWVDRIANNLTSTGQFFCVFMAQMAFIANGLDLLQVGRLVLIKYSQFMAVTKEEKEKAYIVTSTQPPYYSFTMNYTISLTSFLTILTYSIVFPVILPIGFVYFTIRYYVQKYNMLCLFAIPTEGQSKVSESGLYFIELAIIFFQIVTSLAFMLSESDVYYFVGGCFALVSLLMLLLFISCFYRFALKRAKKEAKSLDRMELLGDSTDFRHPLSKVDVEMLGPSSC